MQIVTPTGLIDESLYTGTSALMKRGRKIEFGTPAKMSLVQSELVRINGTIDLPADMMIGKKLVGDFRVGDKFGSSAQIDDIDGCGMDETMIRLSTLFSFMGSRVEGSKYSVFRVPDKLAGTDVFVDMFHTLLERLGRPVRRFQGKGYTDVLLEAEIEPITSVAMIWHINSKQAAWVVDTVERSIRFLGQGIKDEEIWRYVYSLAGFRLENYTTRIGLNILLPRKGKLEIESIERIDREICWLRVDKGRLVRYIGGQYFIGG